MDVLLENHLLANRRIVTQRRSDLARIVAYIRKEYGEETPYIPMDLGSVFAVYFHVT